MFSLSLLQQQHTHIHTHSHARAFLASDSETLRAAEAVFFFSRGAVYTI